MLTLYVISFCSSSLSLTPFPPPPLSQTDLDRAVSLQPSLSDCYWHRHLLYLLLEEHKAALDDLTSLLKLNKKHFAAYRSKAALLAKKGDLSSAVYNLSQVCFVQCVARALVFRCVIVPQKPLYIKGAARQL